MKKLIICLIMVGIILPEIKANAQTIDTTFFGQNYWLPFRHFGGNLESNWANIVASGVKYMRVGGIAYDAQNNHPIGTTNLWSAIDLASGSGSIIAEIRSYGIEPILQVPIDITQSIATNATNAATLVNTVNNTYARGIKYWEIGNEPDGQYAGVNNYNTDVKIRDYIQQVSTAMKGVSGQSGIKIIGPSFAYYDYARYRKFLGGAYDITGSGANGYYIDYIDFHAYPLGDSASLQSASRSAIIGNIQSAYQFKTILDTINYRIQNFTSRTTSNLKISITEANISYEQGAASDRGADGTGPGSFLGGQYWAELIGTSMAKGVALLAFWSPIEGNNGK